MLKRQAEELLSSEAAKGHLYTKEQYKSKKANLKRNYAKLVELNRAGDMKEFEKWVHMLKSPKDLYFEDYDLIEQQWQQEQDKKARSE